ncbi:unnamed protein product [Urochloa decumbens]|uniref:Integral membrane bound transporter domain-containing protein n=1 Tax=Urochloa decumbens TaxID=240449 RepID=A0ABC9H0D4_9POAL
MPPPSRTRTTTCCCVQATASGGDDDQARKLVMGRWRSCVASGLRAALACTIVGLVSLYAPAAVRRHITFPAFSYVVTVIIVTDATLGTALRGAVSALHATLMGAAPSVLALWLAHRTGAAQSVLATSAVVALTAFAVALPESVAKRIALGQIIIIYVATFQRGEGFAPLVHPANVVVCTALGVTAALLAVLLPWPRLASREARDKSTAYKALAAERVRVMADAATIIITDGSSSAAAASCSRQRRWQMAACVSEAKRLASASTALLRRMSAIKGDVQWERVAAAAASDDDISTLEMPLMGMQMALSMMMNDDNNKLICPIQAEHRHAGDIMAMMRDQIRLALLAPNKQTTAGLWSSKPPRASFLCLPLQPQHNKLGPFCLFLFSLYQLRGAAEGLLLVANDANKKIAPAATPAAQQEASIDEQPSSVQLEAADGQAEKKTANHYHPVAAATPTTTTKGNKLVAAAKCGFSLGLAVLLGLLFSNDHGFWSGLIVATTIATGRESTWVVAAARAHGTALGSVYAAVGCMLISQQRLLTMDLRFVALLPWMVLVALLKRSRTYGPAGGIAAALSGIIIMGRRYDEPPMAFTVSRLVETFIGIACAVMADILFQPRARPSLMARDQLTRCITTMLLLANDDDAGRESQSQQVLASLALLRRHAAEAASEPSYLWLPPFPGACYDDIQGSLGRMAQLLHLYHQARMAVVDDDRMAVQRRRFSSLVSTSLRHCLCMLMMPSSSPADHPHHNRLEDEASKQDIEAGNAITYCCYKEEEEEEEDHCEATMTHTRVVLDDVDQAQEAEDAEDRGLLVCCLGSMGLCMREIIREARRLEAHIIHLNNMQPH